MAFGLLKYFGGKALSSGGRAAAGNATRQVARRDAAKRMGKMRRRRFLRRAGRVAGEAALFGAGLLGDFFNRLGRGGAGAYGGVGGLGGGLGGGAGGSGDFDITLPPEVATKKARRISNPTLITISNQITDLTNIALGIAQVAKEERQTLTASLKARESGSQEAALESGAEMIPATGSGEDISPLEDSVQGLIAAIDELRERIEQGGGGDSPFPDLNRRGSPRARGGGALAPAALGLLGYTLSSAPMAVAIAGIDAYAKKAEDESKQEHEQGIARFGLSGNNIDGYKINGLDAGQLSDLPLYYQKVVEGYGVAQGSPEKRTEAREWVRKHNPDGSIKEGAEGVTQRERELAESRSIHNEADRVAKDLRVANDATRAPANSAASNAPTPQPTQTSGAAISIGAQPSPAAAAAEAGTMEAPDQQAPVVNAQPSPQTAQPEQPIGQSGAAIDAASQPGPAPTQAMGNISTPPPTPSPFPTTRPNATGMGNVPEPSYTNMGEIASNLYFGARAEALA
jgi:hypothetical protein